MMAGDRSRAAALTGRGRFSLAATGLLLGMVLGFGWLLFHNRPIVNRLEMRILPSYAWMQRAREALRRNDTVAAKAAFEDGLRLSADANRLSTLREIVDECARKQEWQMARRFAQEAASNGEAVDSLHFGEALMATGMNHSHALVPNTLHHARNGVSLYGCALLAPRSDGCGSPR